jgi:outer membrane biosynthesis protein TonB
LRFSGTNLESYVNASIDHLPAAGFVPDQRHVKRIAAGVALSLVVHALLLSVYRQPRPAPESTPSPSPFTLRLQPPRPAEPVAAPVEATPPAPTPSVTRKKPAPAQRPRPARPVIAVTPETRQSEEETFPVAPAPANPQQEETPPAPKFDVDAARKMARRMANDPDPSRAGTALERLPPKPLETESRLARGIKAAKRANCKDGVPGGLLAPLFLMMDKKDSGCKW